MTDERGEKKDASDAVKMMSFFSVELKIECSSPVIVGCSEMGSLVCCWLVVAMKVVQLQSAGR